MNITERKLRRIIRSVIKESMRDEYQIKNVSDYGDSLYYKLYEHLQDLDKPQEVLDNCQEDIMHLAQLLAQYQNADNRQHQQRIMRSIMMLKDRFIECPEVFEHAKSMI